MISERTIKHAMRFCREDYTKIKGYEEALKSPYRSCIHHINGLTFTRDELKKMNMYYHRPASELLWLSLTDHRKLHNKWNGNPMEGKGYLIAGDKHPMYGRTGEKNPNYGSKRSEETRKKMSENNGMRGRTGDKNQNWKGGVAHVQVLYKMALKRYKAGEITEEEFQPYRDKWAEDRRQRKYIETGSYAC